MDRARSLPPEGSELERGDINPFYSRKLKDEIEPDSLPEAVLPAEFQAIRSEGVIKGGGASSTSLAASKGHGGSFATPPSRRTTQKAIAAANLELGMQSQRGGGRTEGQYAC